ncbi:hypothetical protein Vadar_020650 [Vaccinium darrowii]|uniref:Uncharacterized protein n=1 Tax=Vaccinium darrowii TaxID=229202 RepID=A0ACB7X322_9ERIC|nr:hypothetical protein Vadar_020650 [Vaccinium darrowii]
MYSGITELPITPLICPRLTALLLSGIHLKEIPESFFTYMRCLEVLDLTFDYSIKSLPESISNLGNLHALILYSCDKLNYMLSLEKLKALKVFKLTESSVEEFPKDIEDLVNLIKLDLLYNIHLGLFPNCKLRRLSKLRFLRMDRSTKVTVSAEDLQRLRDFKVVAVKFHNVHELNRYATSQHWQRVGKVLHLAFLPSYRILQDESDDDIEFLPSDISTVCSTNLMMTFHLCLSLPIRFISTNELSNLLPFVGKNCWPLQNESGTLLRI